MLSDELKHSLVAMVGASPLCLPCLEKSFCKS